MKYGLNQAVKEHLAQQQPLTQLESIVLFGVPLLSREVSRLRKAGWIVKTRKVSYAAVVRRINQHASLTPPKNLPILDITLTEYWVSK